MVLIVKEDLEKKDDYEKTIKRKAYNNVMKIFESKYDDLQFVSKTIQFDKKDTNRTRENLEQFIKDHKKNLVYVVFLPFDTSKYNKIKKYLPEKIPIITSIGSVESLKKTNTWVTTTSSLTIGKAIAIKKLMQIEKKDELIALFDSNDSNDTYTKEILEDLNKTISVIVRKIDYNGKIKKEYKNILQEKNKLILLVSKSSTDTKRIFNKFIDKIYRTLDYKNDILLLKIKKEDIQDINLTKGKIFKLTYAIPGYNPDSRLPLYKKVEDMCNKIGKIEKIDKHMCLKIYGDEYIHLHTFLNLALSSQKENDNIESNISKTRDKIQNNIIKHNEANTYYDEGTNALEMFKKSKNFHYSALIESGLSKYYIVRLDKNNNGFLHYNQISNSDENGTKSLSTVYLDMKLSNLIVDSLSASNAYIEGDIRILTTKEKFDLNKMYRMNSLDSTLQKSQITFVKKSNQTIDDKLMYEIFYTFKGNFSINNDLFNFPLDKQKIYISFTPKNMDDINESYLMHLQEQDKKTLNFDKWYIEKIKPFLSEEIMMFKNSAIEQNSSVSYKPVSNFEITIQRKTAIGFIVKFIVPIAIIIFLLVSTQRELRRRRDLGIAISIYISAFAGIISIYFIFNLLIDIESLIGFDFVFLTFLAIPVGLMVYNIFTHMHKHK